MPALTPRRGQKVDDLAKHFRQPRAAVLCHIMHWGLSRAQTETLDGGESEGPVRHLYLFVDTALHAQVEQAATAAGMNIAPWLRSMVRQITIDGLSRQLGGGTIGGTVPRFPDL